jgi:hypothetical protein
VTLLETASLSESDPILVDSINEQPLSVRIEPSLLEEGPLSNLDPIPIVRGHSETSLDRVTAILPEITMLSGEDSHVLNSANEQFPPLPTHPDPAETTSLSSEHSVLLTPSSDEPFPGQSSSTLSEAVSVSGSGLITPVAYKICPVDGKGLGMFSTRRISRGEQVLSETPLIRTTRAANDTMASQQYDALGKPDQEKIQNLANVRPEKGQLLGAIWTNAIALRGSKEEIGLFAVASRMNHSCRPNTNNVWDPNTKQMTVIATRDIEEGEEITSTYIEGFARRDDRRRHLWSLLGFQCYCELCMLPPKLRNRSDQNIDEINAAWQRIKIAAKWENSVGVLAGLGKLLQLYRKECITDWHVAAVYDKAHGIARDNGDGYRVNLLAQRAAEEYALAEGYNSPNATMMRANVEKSAELIEQDEAKGIQSEKPPVNEGAELESWLFRNPKRVIGDCWYPSG